MSDIEKSPIKKQRIHKRCEAHDKLLHQCIDCSNGRNFCEHRRFKWTCKICSPERYAALKEKVIANYKNSKAEGVYRSRPYDPTTAKSKPARRCEPHGKQIKHCKHCSPESYANYLAKSRERYALNNKKPDLQ